MIVAKDGSGTFKTIQEAIDSVPENNKEKVTIYIKDGIYKEKLMITKPSISLIGASPENVVITYDDYARKSLLNGNEMGTFASCSVFIGADHFTAKNITFENNAGCGKVVGQAVAVYVEGIDMAFQHCRFLGRQDTLFTGPLPPKPIEGSMFGGPMDGKEKKPCETFFYDCYLEGDIDFIFGSATAIFHSCEIFSIDRQEETNGFITAASTPEGQPFGYVFIDCRLTSNAAPETVYLGRPWRDYAKTVFINCWMGPHIKKEGWHNWDKKHAETTTFYAEYNSTGPGGRMNSRVKWASILSEEEAAKYTVEQILQADQDWPSLIKQGISYKKAAKSS